MSDLVIPVGLAFCTGFWAGVVVMAALSVRAYDRGYEDARDEAHRAHAESPR